MNRRALISWQSTISGPARGEWWATRVGPDHPLDPLGMATIERKNDSLRNPAGVNRPGFDFVAIKSIQMQARAFCNIGVSGAAL